MSFVEKLQATRQEAIDYIKSVLEKRGSGYELCDPALYEEELEDEFYDLPIAVYVGKHSFHDEYAIVVLDINDNHDITFKGISRTGDASEAEMDFDSDDFDTFALCEIADIMKKLEEQ